MRYLIALTPALLVARASAEPVTLAQPEPTVEPPATTVPVSTPPKTTAAPRPDAASGVVVEDDPSTSESARVLPRALLFFPRIVVTAAAQPIRGIAYVYERYDLLERFTDATFTDDRKFGIYPVGGYESSFGFKVGARLLYKDIFGDSERLKLRADYGGEFRYALGAHIGTGKRFGPIRFEVDSSIERRPREKFYGIGNGDELESTPISPIDPSVEDTAVSSRFQEDAFRNVATIDIAFADELHARTSGALMHRDFEAPPMEERNIETSFDTTKLIGYQDGVKNVYVEEELVIDTRRPASPYATQTLDGTGWLARGHFGITRGVEKDPSHFYSYGGELQRYFDLYDGTRTLSVRAMVDAIGGTDGRTDGKISFIDLPRLGGSEYLRGYPKDRFRDRAVLLGTVEYTWALMNNASAYTFVDVGQAIAKFEDVPEEKIRIGYGFGIQVHTKNTFLMRTQLAFSREGDLVFNLVFSPAFGRRERAGRF
jgi:hypothetical protein